MYFFNEHTKYLLKNCTKSGWRSAYKKISGEENSVGREKIIDISHELKSEKLFPESHVLRWAIENISEEINYLNDNYDYAICVAIDIIEKTICNETKSYSEINIFITAYIDIYKKNNTKNRIFERNCSRFTRDYSQTLYLTIECINELKNILVDQLDFSLGSIKEHVANGSYPALFSSATGGILVHEAIGHMLELGVNSKFEKMLGDQIAPKFLSVIDDPTLDGKYGTCIVDDYGDTAKKVKLIDNGVLSSFLTDRNTSKKLNLENNGHGRREGYMTDPTPRMTNTYIVGCEKKQSVVNDYPKRIVISKIDWGRVKPKTGNFLLKVSEAYVNTGDKKTHLLPFCIRGDVTNLLRNIECIGKEVVFQNSYCHAKSGVIPVSYGQPDIYISNIECIPIIE